ncbi:MULTISPECIES: hypothetical protein [unclassified Mesorhizobium]|uniref:hypothetical protein n=1 Tax=unclassified Mesorhizobium TaxID=325217 RepID=UPI001FEFB579|nr:MULTISPECIES: hypothetical protein [unclassified Mesorhizobium]
MLLRSGSAAIVSTVATPALAGQPLSRDEQPPGDLDALIEAHKSAYTAFGTAVRQIGCSTSDQASRVEESALLAICAYPATGEHDRLAKARYLLEIEARGELDLPEHMQALLRSTMWRG